MSESRTTSTLELVVNEQQMRNMSQIDLSRSDNNINYGSSPKAAQNDTAANGDDAGACGLGQLRGWPARLREKYNEAKSKSDSKTELVLQLFNAFSGILIWSICFICTVLVPILLFIAGITSLDGCPDRPALPYLVFATGFFMTISNLFNLSLALDLPILRNQKVLSNEVKNIVASVVNVIFNCVVAFLYTICAYMVYTTQPQQVTQTMPRPAASETYNETGSMDLLQQNESPLLPINCNRFMFYTTYWFITITLSLMFLLSLIASICFSYNRYRLAVIRGSTPRSSPGQTLNIQTSINTNPVAGANGA